MLTTGAGAATGLDAAQLWGRLSGRSFRGVIGNPAVPVKENEVERII